MKSYATYLLTTFTSSSDELESEDEELSTSLRLLEPMLTVAAVNTQKKRFLSPFVKTV
jgi:hypothetical protein